VTKPLNVVGSKAFWVAFARHSLEVYGLIWLVCEPIALAKPSLFTESWGWYGFLVVASIVVGAIIAWPKRLIEVTKPNSNVTVTVKVGDIFEAIDNVVIGTNDVFDTAFGDVISQRSVQGQFTIKRFGGDVAELDRRLTHELREVSGTIDRAKTKGKQIRYPQGTTVFIEAHGVRHYLCAYCTMSNDLRTDMDLCALMTSLEVIWAKVRDRGQNEGVSMPVLGADFGRLKLTHTQIVQLLVLSFIEASNAQHVAPGLTIYVHSGNESKIDFVALRLWLKGTLWA
jgi:hypothetical protein